MRSQIHKVTLLVLATMLSSAAWGFTVVRPGDLITAVAAAQDGDVLLLVGRHNVNDGGAGNLDFGAGVGVTIVGFGAILDMNVGGDNGDGFLFTDPASPVTIRNVLFRHGDTQICVTSNTAGGGVPINITACRSERARNDGGGFGSGFGDFINLQFVSVFQ